MPTLRSHLRLMRPGDWVKNVFVLLPVAFSVAQWIGTEGRDAVHLGAIVGKAAVAFAAFCVLASGFYSINDALDAEEDRRHPVKRLRPVASGAITVRGALVFGAVLIAAGLAIGFALNRALGLTLFAYLVLQASYNAWLKRVMLVDVIAIAVGFGLRAAAGAVAVSTKLSIWLVLCVFFLCLYLGFIKRLCDLASAERAGNETWRSPAGYDSRGELNWLLGVTAVLAMTTFLMYALSTHVVELFGVRARGFALLIPFVLVAIHRFYRRASEGSADSPLAALREDRLFLASVLAFVVGVAAILYVPPVNTALERLFIIDPLPGAPGG